MVGKALGEYLAIADRWRTHHGEILPSLPSGNASRGRSCHCRSVENASRRNFPIAEHFEMRLSGMQRQPSPNTIRLALVEERGNRRRTLRDARWRNDAAAIPPRSSEPQPAKAGPHPRIKLSARGCAFARVCTLARVPSRVGAPLRACTPSRGCAFACLCSLAFLPFWP